MTRCSSILGPLLINLRIGKTIFKTFKPLWMINVNTIHILVIYTISYSSLIIPKIHFHIQYFTISNQFKYAHKFNSVLQFNSVMSFNSVLTINSVMSINSVMPINSIMPLMNLTYVFDIQDIRVTGTVLLGCRPV